MNKTSFFFILSIRITGCRPITSRPRTIHPLLVFLPPFFDLIFPQDLVFIEEAFERLLLDYDRVFSAMGVPACLWRRTGEIYKGNREFSELVGVEGYMMREVMLLFFQLLAACDMNLVTFFFFFRAVCVYMNLWLKNLPSIIGRYDSLWFTMKGETKEDLCRNMVTSRLTLVKKLYSHPAFYATNLLLTLVRQAHEAFLLYKKKLTVLPNSWFVQVMLLKTKMNSNNNLKRKGSLVVVFHLRLEGISGVFLV